MVSKSEAEAKAASRKVYEVYAPQILAVTGDDKKALMEEAHLRAKEAAQKIYPNVNTLSVKNQLGGYIKAEKKKQAEAAERKKNELNAANPHATGDKGKESAEGAGNDEEGIDDVLNISPEVQKYIDEKLAAALGKPKDDGANTIKVPQEPLDPRIVKDASRRMADKVVARFDAVIEKIYLDDYRKALFASWKAMTGYEGDLGDFIIEAFDLFFKIKGIDLEIVTHRPLNVEKGMIRNV